jgi:hypothetical protein
VAGVVSFDYAAWIALYPQFTPGVSPTGQPTGVDSALANQYFLLAEVLHDNLGCNVVINDTIQLSLLGMLVAHIATLFAPGSAMAGSGLAGPLTHAAEGSVNIGIKPFDAQGTVQWLTQTQYGALYWYATSVYRTMRYRIGPRRIFNPPVWPYGTGGGPWDGGGWQR